MIFVYMVAFYLITNLIGTLLEKIKIPKIYAALFTGVALSSTEAVIRIVETSPITILSQAGMFSLLFLLGYGLDIKKITKQKSLIFKVTAAVILSESVVGITILHFFFHVEWLLAFIIAISFATVGEVALLPLLKEFKILDTHLGQTILGVAILDDLVEILAFILLITFVTGLNYTEIVNEILPLVAIGSGVLFGNWVKKSEKIDKVINFMALAILGPIFFFTAGTEVSLKLLADNFPVILAFTLAIKATKILSAYLTSHKQLGNKKSIVLGVSLGIKFSTSIVVLIILLQKQLITTELFSILLGIKVVFKFVIPIVLSILLSKWQLDLTKPIESKA